MSDSERNGRRQQYWRLIQESLAGKQHDYTSGSLPRAIVLLAIPMVLEMAMESVFAVCDIFFVARLGADAVATVGLTESMLSLLYALAMGLSMATTAMVARRIGEKRPKAAAVSGVQAIYLGLGISLVVGVPGWIFAPRLLELMGASAELIASGSGYTRLLLGFNVVIMLLFVNNAIFRGAGDATLAMRSLWLANGINLVLDPCLIFGLGPFPELGVTGAALATTIGRGTGVVYQLWILHGVRSRIQISAETIRPVFSVMHRLVRLSLGGICQMLIATASWVTLMRLVSPFGSNALAGYTIAVRVTIFALLPSWGLANAAATLVGQNLGAQRIDRAERSVGITAWFNTAFLGLITVVFVAAAPLIVAVFTQDPEVSQVGINSLRIMSYGYVFFAWGMVLVQAFNGAGDTWTPTYINLVCFWMVQIPLAWWLSTRGGFGSNGVFWSVMLAESLLAVVSAIVFRRGGWKTQAV